MQPGMKAFVLVHGVHHLVSEEVKFISDSGSVVEEEELKLVHGVFKGAEVGPALGVVGQVVEVHALDGTVRAKARGYFRTQPGP